MAVVNTIPKDRANIFGAMAHRPNALKHLLGLYGAIAG